MDSIYFYILLVSCVPYFVWKFFTNRAKADRMLNNLIKMNENTSNLIEESNKLQNQILDESILDNPIDWIKMNKKISQKLINEAFEIERQELAFYRFISDFEVYISFYYRRKLFDIKFHGNRWFSMHQAISRDHLMDAKFYVEKNFNPSNRKILVLAYELSNEFEEMFCHDGSVVNRVTLKNMLDKWDLNEKLQTSLKEKKKTKVAKI